jgi:hypothetical protein
VPYLAETDTRPVFRIELWPRVVVNGVDRAYCIDLDSMVIRATYGHSETELIQIGVTAMHELQRVKRSKGKRRL